MKILRYSDKVQQQLSSKTKPEPWLHCIIAQQRRGYMYAIYVWDTRQIIETGQCNSGISGKPAVDNHQPLRGDGAGNFDMSNAGRDERLKARCRKAWADYVDARDMYWDKMETKPRAQMMKQYNTMMSRVRKLADLGMKHNIPEWAKYDGRAGLYRDEYVQCPNWVFD